MSEFILNPLDIVGGVIWFDNDGDFTIIVCDISGNLYHIDGFQPHYWEIREIIDIGKYIRLNDRFKRAINDDGYNEILNRIEDIYGMGIDEFSLGQLSYV